MPATAVTPIDIDWLVSLVEQIVRESGDPTGFDARTWVEEWLSQPCPALGGRRPVEYMSTEDGRQVVRQVVEAMQSGAYL